MSRKAFHNLLERYLKGKCSEEEQEIVRRWYDLLDSEQDLALKDADFEELEVRLWDKINEETNCEDGKKKGLPRRTKIKKREYISIAAAIIFLLIGTVWAKWRSDAYLTDPDFVKTHIQKITVVSNSSDEPLEIVLPDSSHVRLFKGAEIKYATKFDQREVALNGDALFSVTANPKNPFMVFHDKMITKVLGTCFKITAGSSLGNDQVTVYSGKVQVIRSGKKKNFVERIVEKPAIVNLTINQRVVLDERQNTFNETLAEKPVPIDTKRTLLNEISFNEISLPQLAEKLSEIYNIPIKVDPKVKHTTFTGDLSNLELFSQLGMICNVTDTKYKIQGKTILIQ